MHQNLWVMTFNNNVMASIEMKTNRLENASPFPFISPQHEYIDLRRLFLTLYAAKLPIMQLIFPGLCALSYPMRRMLNKC
jgi:hypothetical protein